MYKEYFEVEVDAIHRYVSIDDKVTELEYVDTNELPQEALKEIFNMIKDRYPNMFYKVENKL